ncbi:MAG: hypothetical protein IKY02_06355 [Lachnospiraceae bacterium]|nr:hypothetical protein [Lachnospiraceae bacterium]MBR5739596.1 hypothetical protein [Lachnospiraceae bacterium]
MRKYRLRVGLDVDDVLYECNSYALKLLRQKYGDDPVFDIENIRSWGKQGTIADERIEFFASPKFVASQPLFKGAQKFVRELCKMADVFFITSVPAQCMTARAKRLAEDFPEVPSGNLLIGTRKDLVNIDILLDDAAHNISSSQASYPVLMRRPWNASLSGLLSVNSYSDFLHLAKIIGKSFVEKPPELSNGGVLCLVGPSGTGKTEIASRLTEDPRFVKPITTTTKPKLPEESDQNYRFITEEQFIAEKNANRFIETTVYSKYHFGTSETEIAPIVKAGKIAVIPIDICGAMTLKNLYRSRVALVYTDRAKEKMLADILHRDVSDDDKISRMMSIDFEIRNIEFCDCSVCIDDGLDKCFESICKEFKL